MGEDSGDERVAVQVREQVWHIVQSPDCPLSVLSLSLVSGLCCKACALHCAAWLRQGCGHSTPAMLQDRFLPIANISRIMKKALPSNGKIAKDAKETVQECVSEFISFITSE